MSALRDSASCPTCKATNLLSMKKNIFLAKIMAEVTKASSSQQALHLGLGAAFWAHMTIWLNTN